MKVDDLVRAMQSAAPVAYAEPWDNVGLLVGDPASPLSRGLLCIDLTEAVLGEAVAARCEAVIAYHPPIFSPLKQVLAGSVVFEAIRQGVAVYSPHTALDVVVGGTNDVLADAVGFVNRKPIQPLAPKPAHAKLVTFVPRAATDAVRTALFTAGAGAGDLSNYAECSFTTPGTGTFRPGVGSSPAIGSVGCLEQVDEQKLEMLVPLSSLDKILFALREAHPYEEPAVDIIPLIAEPSAAGMGRFGTFEEPMSVQRLIDRVKTNLMINHVLLAGPAERMLRTASVCAGSCGSKLDDVIALGADVLVTGELRHHDALKAAAAGLTVLCTLHSNSERIALAALADRLTRLLPGIEFRTSRLDRDPFSVQ